MFLFDLDGVIRLYSDDDTRSVERKFGLKPGIIDRFAFTEDLLTKVTTGRITRREWITLLGAKIDNMEAAFEWENRPVYVDNEIIDIIRKLKVAGFQVCLITNGTNNLRTELTNLGIENEFDHIFNSSDIGIAKPSSRIYQIVINDTRIDPANIAYIDDNRENVQEAKKIGMKVYHYKGFSNLLKWLHDSLFVNIV